MSLNAEISRDGGTLLVRVPLKRRQRGGRRLMIASDVPPALCEPSPGQPTGDPILKALGRAWRWKRLLELGDYSSLANIAAEEKVAKSYICRLLRLTLLSPAFTESIIDGTLSRDVLLADLIDVIVVNWAEQDCRAVGAAKA
jgi:hypothetical protein